MKFYRNINKRKIATLTLITLLIAWGSVSWNTTTAYAALITSTSIQPSNSVPSATGVTYTTKFTFPSTNTLECIQIKFATTTGMGTPATGMTSGSGFTLSGGGLTQANWTNYGSTNGTLEIFAASAQTPTTTQATVNWSGVTNT